jgi:hypothetical protein
MFPREENLFIENGSRIVPSRTLKNKDFDEIKRYLINNARRINEVGLFLDLSNNRFSSHWADKIEEEAFVQQGLNYSRITCDKQSGSKQKQHQNFFSFLKKRVFESLKPEDLKEAAEAIVYIYNEFVTRSNSSGGPLPDDTKLTSLSGASRETIRKFFDDNPEIAFRLYVWFHLHYSKAENYYQHKNESLLNLKQARWKEIRKSVFESKLKELNNVDTYDRAKNIERFNNNTLERVLLPYSICVAANQLHKDIQEGHDRDSARGRVLVNYIEPFCQMYAAASEVTLDVKTQRQLTEASFTVLGEYGQYSPANYTREAAGRNVAFLYWKHYFIPYVEEQFQSEESVSPENLKEKLTKMAQSPETIPYQSVNNMEEIDVLDFTIGATAYDGGRSSVQAYSDLRRVDLSFHQNKIEEGDEILNQQLSVFYSDFRNVLDNARSNGQWSDIFYKYTERQKLKALIDKMDTENSPVDFHTGTRLHEYVREAMDILEKNDDEKEKLEKFLKNEVLLPDSTAYNAAVISYYYLEHSLLKDIFSSEIKAKNWDLHDWIKYYSYASNSLLASQVVQIFLDNKNDFNAYSISDGKKLDIEIDIEQYYENRLTGSYVDNQFMLDLSVRPFNVSQVRGFLEGYPEVKRIKLNNSFSAGLVLATVKELAAGSQLPRINFNNNPNIDENTRVEIYQILDQHRLKSCIELKKQLSVPHLEGKEEIENIFNQYNLERRAISLRAELQTLHSSLYRVDSNITALVQKLDRAIETESKIDGGFINESISEAYKYFQEYAKEPHFKDWWRKELILKEKPLTAEQALNLARNILFIYREYFKDTANKLPSSLKMFRKYLPAEGQSVDDYAKGTFTDSLSSEVLYHWFMSNRSSIERYYPNKKKDYLTYWTQVVENEYPRKFQEYKNNEGGDSKNTDDRSVTRAFNTGKLDTVLIPYEVLNEIKSAHSNIKQKLQELRKASSGQSEEELAQQAVLEISKKLIKTIARVILERLVGKDKNASLYKKLSNSLGILDGSITQEKIQVELIASCAGLFQFVYNASDNELSEDKFTQNFVYAIYRDTFEKETEKYENNPNALVDYLIKLTEQDIIFTLPVEEQPEVIDENHQRNEYAPINSDDSPVEPSVEKISFSLSKSWEQMVVIQRAGASLPSERGDDSLIVDIFTPKPQPSIFRSFMNGSFMNWIRGPWTLFGWFSNKSHVKQDIPASQKISFVKLVTPLPKESPIYTTRNSSVANEHDAVVDMLVVATDHSSSSQSASIIPFASPALSKKKALYEYEAVGLRLSPSSSNGSAQVTEESPQVTRSNSFSSGSSTGNIMVTLDDNCTAIISALNQRHGNSEETIPDGVDVFPPAEEEEEEDLLHHSVQQTPAKAMAKIGILPVNGSTSVSEDVHKPTFYNNMG